MRGSLPRRSDRPRDPQSLQAPQVRAEARHPSDDGIIIVNSSRAAPAISLPGFSLLVASFFVFKGGVIAWLGAADYATSISYLKSGTVFEQAAAFVMTPDFLSQFLAGQFKVVLS